jgi:multidrug efflux pump subunit AcrA (membrane-fusion protein)
VEAQLAESQVASVSQNARVDVLIDALNENYEGVVDTVIPTADAVSKTFTVKVKIPNKDLKILVGMSAKLKINSGTLDNVIMAVQNAVLEDSDGTKSIFIAKNGKAQKREVKTGPVKGDKVVLLSGAEQGEKLIVLGQRDLKDGEPVNIVN